MVEKLKIFLISCSIICCLFVVSLVVLAIDRRAGLVVGLGLLTIAGIAFFKPLSALGLTHRGFIASVATVGLFITLGSAGMLIEEAELMKLRETDPGAYLEKIERDQARWLRELKELAPDRYVAEQAKIDAERKAAEREAARVEAERNAAEKEAALVEAERKAAEREEAARIEAERRAAKRAEAKRLATERSAARAQEQAREAAEYVARIEREIAGLSSFDPRQYTDSQTSLVVGLGLFSFWAQIYDDGSQLSLNDQQEELRQKYKQTVIAHQRRALPIFRDNYGPILRKELWEHDASARTFGSGFTTVEFVAGFFAANRNIKEFQKSASETLRALRFKRARYKWYEDAREYQFYDMDALPDGELVIWEEDGRYRKVN